MRKRNAQKTRARLLESAIVEFSLFGYSGGRVNRLAARARTNKQSLYRYFGSKRGAFEAAMNAVLPLRSEALASDDETLDGLDREIEYSLRLQSQHPELSRLLMWETLERLPTRRDRRVELFGDRRRLIERGMKEGVFDPNLDVDQVLTDMSALLVFPFVMPRHYAILRRHSPYEPREVEARRLHVRQVLRKLLVPRDSPGASRSSGRR